MKSTKVGTKRPFSRHFINKLHRRAFPRNIVPPANSLHVLVSPKSPTDFSFIYLLYSSRLNKHTRTLAFVEPDQSVLSVQLFLQVGGTGCRLSIFLLISGAFDSAPPLRA